MNDESLRGLAISIVEHASHTAGWAETLDQELLDHALAGMKARVEEDRHNFIRAQGLLDALEVESQRRLRINS